MDERRKISCVTASEISSPVLLRRRLSAPETVMRKHSLAQQRSESQDGDNQSSEYRNFPWSVDVGSDTNLSRRKDSGFMRKSMLMRRFLNNAKSPNDKSKRFYGAYSEWQYSTGKLSTGRSSYSLNSNHSSPEHIKSFRSLTGEEFKSSSSSPLKGSRKVSPKHMYHSSPRRKMSVYSNNYQDAVNSNSFRNSVESSTSLRTTTTENRLTTTETVKTTDTTETTTSTTTRTYGTSFSDNSDSAYTNSQSNYTRTSHSETCCTQTQEPNDSNTYRIEETSVSNNNSTGVSDPETRHESSTQTPDTANLNVISNVQLSQSTLNMIFNQVLQDVQNKQPNSLNIKTLSATLPNEEEKQTKTVNEAKVIKVQQMPSFYLNSKEDIVITPEHNRIIKYMISNIGTGSPYSKPAEIPQVVVPRYSAMPRTSSMEVNTSSDDSTDKESDTVSLVDSLEDPMSPKNGQNHDEKLVRGDLSILLPDNSDRKVAKAPQKPAAFFIPIENVKHEEFKAVSELLPAKVREKLSKRQQKREQKLQHSKNNFTSPRSDSNYISASDNQISFTVKNNLNSVDVQSIPTLPDINSHKRRMSKPLMQNVRKIKTESQFDRLSKPLKRKSIGKFEKPDSSSSSKSKSSQKFPQKSQAKLDSGGKRIEILEIMECVDDADRLRNCLKGGKSKIPVLVHQKLPKIDKKPLKPVFIEFGHVLDPKMDQLIANILIDTLNKCEESGEASNSEDVRTNKKYQKFEAIPEERSLHSSMEDSLTKSDKSNANNNLIEATANIMTNQVLKNSNIQESNNNKVVNNNDDISSATESNLKGLPKNESIPHGWITFYMLHKNNGSPESTSDEGTNISKAKPNQCFRKKERHSFNQQPNDKENSSVKTCENMTVAKKERSNTLDMVSSSDAFTDTLNSARNIARKKHLLSKRASRDSNRNRPSHLDTKNPTNGWSVTVSGTNTYGQYAPDVEMRLKFPTPHRQADDSKNDKAENEEHIGCNNLFHGKDSSCHLPKRHHNQQQKSESVVNAESTTDNTYRSGRLPVIQQKTNVKVSESWNSSITSSMIPLKLEPRQTKTSTRRLALNRPRTLQPVQFSTENFLKLSAERQLAAILHKFPGILSINGNGINPEPKSCLESESNLPRSIYTNPR